MNNKDTKTEELGMWHPAHMIATVCNVGLIPFAPGTHGTFAGVLLFILIAQIGQYIGGVHAAVFGLVAFTIMIFPIGIWASNRYMQAAGKHDPKEIVIDEVAGVFVAIILGILLLDIAELLVLGETVTYYEPYVVEMLMSVVVLFRVFDIAKPPPINIFDERMKGGFGVMFDDLVAGVFAAVALMFSYIIILVLYY
jgi:phosphatidylglycerophosphatase A